MRFIVLSIGLAACGPPDASTDPVKSAEKFRAEQTPEILVERAKAYAAVGDTARAEQYLAAALNQGGDARTILPMLVKVCVQDGRYQMALEYMRPYAEKHPSDVRTRFMLGTLYSAVGDVEHAKQELEYVVAAHPEDPDPHFAYAMLLKNDFKDDARADTELREYLRLAPHGDHADAARTALTKDESK